MKSGMKEDSRNFTRLNQRKKLKIKNSTSLLTHRKLLIKMVGKNNSMILCKIFQRHPLQQFNNNRQQFNNKRKQKFQHPL